MICIKTVKKYCSEDISKIENYEQAVNDKTQTWDCHHRAEILPCGRFKQSDLIKFNLYWHRPANELVFMTEDDHLSMHSVGRVGWWLGKHHTEETKAKISAASSGRVHSEETRQKISTRLKNLPYGWTGWVGRHHSQETKAKMSAASKGEHNPFFGRHHSQETKAKISAANSGRVVSEETRARRSRSLKGKNTWTEGRHWWNNEVSEKLARDCPGEDWVEGRICRRNSG